MHFTYINQTQAVSLFGFTPLASLAFPKLTTMTWIPSLSACPLPLGGLLSREQMQIGMSVRVMNMQVTDGKKRERKNPLSDPAPAGIAVAPKRPFKVTLSCGDQAKLGLKPEKNS